MVECGNPPLAWKRSALRRHCFLSACCAGKINDLKWIFVSQTIAFQTMYSPLGPACLQVAGALMKLQDLIGRSLS